MPSGKTYQVTNEVERERLSDIGTPRLVNAAAWLETLAALEAEFKTILEQHASSTRRVPERRSEP